MKFCPLAKKVLLSHSDPPKVSIACDLGQFYILTDNISATDWDIKKLVLQVINYNPSPVGQKNWWTLVH